MAVKSFIRGDFRSLIIDNDYPTNYKIYYNGKWNYIQDEESFINRLLIKNLLGKCMTDLIGM